MQDRAVVRHALISVSDKSGLEPLALALAGRGVALLSTGGTAEALRALGCEVTEISEATGFPEMMGGRVKTLHPRVHGGLLARRDDENHRAEMAAHGIGAIDLLVVNLYPFEDTLAGGADFAACLENIDIGGPAMIRSAAKNHAWVACLTDPGEYPGFLAELDAHDGATRLAWRRAAAARAFAHTAAYDAAVAGWLKDAAADEDGAEPPRRTTFGGRLIQGLRYGENPHQAAAFYRTAETRPGVATARQIQGKALSYNNIADTDAAYELAAEFPADGPAACVIVKHANPCGVALADTPEEAWRRALACDPVSAFGGIVALNRPLDEGTARAIAEIFTEVVIAPGVAPAAAEIFAAKRNLRLLEAGGLPDPAAPGAAVRSVAGGFLVQDRDAGRAGRDGLQVVTRRAPEPGELDDLLFAWRVAKHVKSNAIVLARGGATLGIGAGQMSRVDSTRLAAAKAAAGGLLPTGEGATAPDGVATGSSERPSDAGGAARRAAGIAAASDAFFPFADGLIAAAEAGATAVIQPGGSVRDAEVIAAADERGMAMVFTAMRHFRH